MINIESKEECCGCNACVQICPKQCIEMHDDDEGFLYPHVDKNSCIDCHLCEKVCPVLNQDQPRNPLGTYAAKNIDENIRKESSSGGLFTLLAEYVLDKDGVVFGARFDKKWNVVHDFTETKKGLSLFRGSKYVQSQIGSNYKIAESFLKQDRKVLFSGTPCQIAGLRKYLRREYDNLITLDFVCHGVPSPCVWDAYLKSKFDNQELSYIDFRDKRLGWKNFSFTIYAPSEIRDGNEVLLTETLHQNIFIKGFLKNLYLRPSCYKCPSRQFKSGSDITIGDYWGIGRYYPIYDDDKGVGLVCINSHRGEELYSKLVKDSFETPYEYMLSSNPCIERSVQIPKLRNKFWLLFHKEGITAIDKICNAMKPSLIHRGLSWVKRKLKL